MDAETAELVGEPDLTQGLVGLPFEPGAGWPAGKGLKDLGCGQGRETRVGNDLAEFREQGESRVYGFGLFLAGELVEGLEGEAGPIAAGNQGVSKQRTPIVGQPIEGRGRQHRIGGFERGEIVLGGAGELAGEHGFDFEPARVERDQDLVRVGGNQVDDDGAVGEGIGERADAGEDGRGEGVKGAHAVVAAIAAVGAGAAFVAGIEQAAEFLVLVEVGINFVQQQGGMVLVHDAEQDGGGEILGPQWAGREAGDDIESSGFAAAGVRGREVEARSLEKSAKAMGMSGPKRRATGAPEGRKR
jgi:hypothetical protein